MGIRHIGQENAKLIARHLKTSKNFLNLSNNNNAESLSNIDGIGITQIQSIKKFFSNNLIADGLYDNKLILNLLLQMPPLIQLRAFMIIFIC